MSVMNFICENCNKHRVCGIVGKITVFDDDAKKPLGLNITIDSCQEYEIEN